MANVRALSSVLLTCGLSLFVGCSTTLDEIEVACVAKWQENPPEQAGFGVLAAIEPIKSRTGDSCGVHIINERGDCRGVWAPIESEFWDESTCVAPGKDDADLTEYSISGDGTLVLRSE